MNIIDFQKMKQHMQKITMVTCYDYWSARIISESNIDCVLVGDSLAMVMHGHSTTIPATLEMMKLHTAAVVRGAPNKFIIGDMPFLSYRKGIGEGVQAVEKLMHAGAHAVKLEGGAGNYALIAHLVTSGVPVMGHLGLTPQSVHQLGGFKVQAKEGKAAARLMDEACALEQAGCFALVLECVPSIVAKEATKKLNIPTIGIGAGPYTSGQVLVLQDMLGMQADKQYKFLKKYMHGFELVKNALNQYHNEVKTSMFPLEEEHCY